METTRKWRAREEFPWNLLTFRVQRGPSVNVKITIVSIQTPTFCPIQDVKIRMWNQVAFREEELHNDQNGTGCPSEIRRRVTWREDWDGHRRESLGILLCSLVHKPLVIDSYDHPRGSISLCIYIYTHASVEGWSCEEYKCLGGVFYHLVCVDIIYICVYIYM